MVSDKWTMTSEDVDVLDRVIEDLRHFVLIGETNTSDNSSEEEVEEEEVDDDDEEDEETSDEESEEPEADQYLTPVTLDSLPKLRVNTPSGEIGFLEFEDVGEDDSVDVLYDDGTIIIDSVTHLKVSGNTISAWDGDQWHDFTFKKYSKRWESVLAKDVVFGVDRGEEE